MKKKLLFLVAALALFVPSVMAAEKNCWYRRRIN